MLHTAAIPTSARSTSAPRVPLTSPPTPQTMESQIRLFFRSPLFAVVGASTDPSKFGHKVFAWYLSHSLPVTPINPSSRTTAVLSIPTIPSVRALKDPQNTSVSIITPPPVTLEVLREAAEVGVKRVWMQPGAWDRECVAFAKEKGMEAVVYGHEEELGHEGACVLVHGEAGMKAASCLRVYARVYAVGWKVWF
ncbi:CoA binding domain-containing protein [Sphaerosporella brunnea]|uniref:CoA binding domain-containing protein n=1 Tax=Sphaerosporella brunnea TaxID=1250544 RepID=A0A5J5ESR0_9PEZI|nr:CoA binding domain-containing protein [Sphaerosporella brunnea]